MSPTLLPADNYIVINKSIITEEDKNFIMAAIPDGDKYVAKKIPVELGEETSYYVEITSDELEEEMLIITDSTGVKEGKKVNVVIE